MKKIRAPDLLPGMIVLHKDEKLVVRFVEICLGTTITTMCGKGVYFPIGGEAYILEQ